jgi:methionine aminotransferase
VQRVHQFVTFTVHTPSQVALAEFVRRDVFAADLGPFYERKRDLFLELIEGTPFRPLPCAGTYFQMLDYSAIRQDGDVDVAQWLLKTHGVAAIPPSAFCYKESAGPVLRFCFAKKDETLQKAAERLRGIGA